MVRRREKKVGARKIEMDGMVFQVPHEEMPLETYHNALLTYIPGQRFSAVFEDSAFPHYERKKYSSLGRIKRWVDEVIERAGGVDKLDPEKEPLYVAYCEKNTTYGKDGRHDHKTWLFGRLIRHHVDRFARMLYHIDGEDEPREGSYYGGNRIHVCDDPEHVAELNEAEQAVRDAIEFRDKLRKRYLRPLTSRLNRAQVVKLSKKQKNRIRARERRAQAA